MRRHADNLVTCLAVLFFRDLTGGRPVEKGQIPAERFFSATKIVAF